MNGASKRESSMRPCPSGVRIIAISTRWPWRPVTRPDHSPSIGIRPSRTRPSSIKNSMAASRSSTTMPTLSIRLTVMLSLVALTGIDAAVSMRIVVDKRSQSAAIEWLPFAFALRQTIGDGPKYGRVGAHAEMTGADFDVFRKLRLRNQTGRPGDDAIGLAQDRSR